MTEREKGRINGIIWVIGWELCKVRFWFMVRVRVVLKSQTISDRSGHQVSMRFRWEFFSACSFPIKKHCVGFRVKCKINLSNYSGERAGGHSRSIGSYFADTLFSDVILGLGLESRWDLEMGATVNDGVGFVQGWGLFLLPWFDMLWICSFLLLHTHCRTVLPLSSWADVGVLFIYIFGHSKTKQCIVRVFSPVFIIQWWIRTSTPTPILALTPPMNAISTPTLTYWLK